MSVGEETSPEIEVKRMAEEAIPTSFSERMESIREARLRFLDSLEKYNREHKEFLLLMKERYP